MEKKKSRRGDCTDVELCNARYKSVRGEIKGSVMMIF